MKIIYPLAFCLTLMLGGLGLANEVPYYPHVYNPQKWPEARLTFSQQGTLKNLYDAGLRPYRFPGLENSVLQVKHFRMRLELASGKKLPEFPVELMTIHPFNDGEISTLKARTPDLTVHEARMYMQQWLPYGKMSNGSPSSEYLEKYLEAAQKDLMNFNHIGRGFDNGCAVGWREPGWKTLGGGPSCAVYFRKTSNPKKPLFLNISFNWSSNRPQKDRRYYRIPIPPPSGYEDVSMKAPKNFGPDSAVDILRSQGYDVGDGKGGKPMPGSGVKPTRLPREPSKTPSEDVIATDTVDKSIKSKWPIFVAIAVVLGGAYLWLKRASKKS